uniref:Decapping nuclease n=1 Tax=Trichuris muris TaxID=70415 RepID=A0A5S6Q9E9_TRIMR
MEALQLHVCQFDALPFPHFSYPTEVGYFSKSEGEAIVLDKSKLGVLDLSRANVGADLNAGYTQFEDTFSLESQNELLEWIVARRREMISSNIPSPTLLDIVHGAKVVIWRGMLRKFGTLLCSQEEWRCSVERFQGILFVREMDNDQRTLYDQSMTDLDRRMRYWGHSFENLVIKYDGKFNSTVNNGSSYFVTVRRSRIGEVVVLFAGEVDCVDPETNKYIELKTSREQRTVRVNAFDNCKFAKWWLQSFLVGIPQIVCCERDQKGCIQRLVRYDVSSVPKHVRTWSASVCVNTIVHILAYLVENIQEERVVYIAHYKPEWGEVRFSVDEKCEFSLPHWFISEFT